MATSPSEHAPLRGPSRPSPGAARSRTEELYAQYARTVTGLCRALLRNAVEAEDATQQVFLSAQRALLNGSTPREPAAWLATIARNECWARISARMREPLPTDDAETASTLPDPLAEAIRRADLAALWHAIEELPRQQRQALLLREFGGLTYEELAAALAVSTAAVESLLFRARRGVRRKMRAAYAALGGATWLEGFARLVGGGSGVLAPAATKAVALGIGAAAVTGGAVVAPHLLAGHRGNRPHPVRRPLVVAPARRAVVGVSSRPVRKPVEASFREDRRRDSGDSGGRSQGDSSSERASGTGDRESAPPRTSGDATATTAGTDGRDSSSSDGTTTTQTTQEQAGGTTTTETSVVAVLDTSTTTTASTDGGGDGTSGGY